VGGDDGFPVDSLFFHFDGEGFDLRILSLLHGLVVLKKLIDLLVVALGLFVRRSEVLLAEHDDRLLLRMQLSIKTSLGGVVVSKTGSHGSFVISSALLHKSIVRGGDLSEFPRELSLSVGEVGVSSLEVLVELGLHGLLLHKPRILLRNVAFVVLVHGAVLVADLLVEVVLGALHLLGVLVLEVLDLGKVVLVVPVDVVVLLADLIGVALLDLGAFLEPGVSFGLVLVVQVVDFVVLGADLTVVALLVATGLSSMVVLKSLRAVGMVLVNGVDIGLALREFAVVLGDQALVFPVGCVQVVAELTVVDVHLSQAGLHFLVVRLAGSVSGSVVTGVVLRSICGVLLLTLLQVGLTGVKLFLMVVLSLGVEVLPSSFLIVVLFVEKLGALVVLHLGGLMGSVKLSIDSQVRLVGGVGEVALLLDRLVVAGDVGDEFVLAGLVSFSVLCVRLNHSSDLLVEFVAGLFALASHIFELLHIGLQIVVHIELLAD